MAKKYTFELECAKKYGDKYESDELYHSCMDAFDALPMCGLVNARFLCMHGGLSPDIESISDIDALDRFDEIPKSGPLCDLVWSDSSDGFLEKNSKEEHFTYNTN